MWIEIHRIQGPGLYQCRNGCTVNIAYHENGESRWIGHPLNTKGEPCKQKDLDRNGQRCWRYSRVGLLAESPPVVSQGSIWHSLELTHKWEEYG